MNMVCRSITEKRIAGTVLLDTTDGSTNHGHSAQLTTVRLMP